MSQNFITSLDEDVKKALVEEVRKKIIANRVALELDKCAQIIEGVSFLRHNLDSEFKGICGYEQFDCNGSRVSVTFTKEQSQRKMEIQKEIKTLDEMLSNALSESKYDKLSEYLSKHLDRSMNDAIKVTVK